ncbi:MAG: hypothetical protein KDE57_17140 [Calditrichaeota bacterium]|nr:hypothetical protein [Calditrichota bacterium]
MSNWLRGIIGVGMVVGFIFFGGCSDDDPTAPDTGSVSGTVTFVGTWPASREVQVSIYQNLSAPYIPMAAPDGFTDPIASGTTTYNYTLEGLEKGTYTAIYVSARDPQNPAATQLIGMYWQFTDSVGVFPTPQGNLPDQAFGPKSVTIDNDNIDLTGLNIVANLNYSP